MPAPVPRMHGLSHDHGGPDPTRIAWEMVGDPCPLPGLSLRAVADGADAYLERSLGGPHDSLWISVLVYVSPDGLAAIYANSSGLVVNLTGSDMQADIVVLTSDGGGQWQTVWGVGGAPVAGEGLLVELHHVRGGTCELYVAGDLVIDGVDTTDVPIDTIQVGLFMPTYTPAAAFWVGDVKVGTSRGDGDVFADDFEDGTLAAWTTTSGDVAVVRLC